MKFVLITGMDSESVRDEVARSGADAYFYKPINISEFLDYVQGCLSSTKLAEVESEEAADDEDEDESEMEGPSLSDHLSSLRQELEALCVILVDEHGQIMAQAGNLPDLDDDEGFLASLMAAFSSAAKVAYSLELEQPQDLLYFVGHGKGYLLAHVGPSLGLMLAIEVTSWEDERTWSSMRSIPNKVQDLMSVLIDMGAYSEQGPEPEFPGTVELEEEAGAEVALTELDAIFKQAKKKIKAEDVDAFWDSATAEESDELTRTDAISYDQARKLGLAPEEK
jgi:hypothetical protein